MQDRAAARRDRMNEHHRRAHAHAGDLGLEGAFVFTIKVRNVGRCAAHVETDQPVEAGLPSGFRHADHAAGGAGQDRVLALEQFGGGQPAGRHHEHQARIGAPRVEVLVDLRHIAPQDWREISVDHGGIASADQLDQRRHLVADRHLAEAHLARQLCNALLVFGKTIGMHQHDGDRVDAVGFRRSKMGAHGIEIGLALDRAVGAHALVDFGHALIDQIGLDDLARENLRPRLVADLQRVAETFGDQ